MLKSTCYHSKYRPAGPLLPDRTPVLRFILLLLCCSLGFVFCLFRIKIEPPHPFLAPDSSTPGSGILAGPRSPESWVVAACPWGPWT